MSNTIKSEAKQQQEFIDSLKEAIKSKILPDFKERDETRQMTFYALIELAVDLSPNGSFIYYALMEVADFYVKKVHNFDPTEPTFSYTDIITGIRERGEK